jgi:hypothetical protein
MHLVMWMTKLGLVIFIKLVELCLRFLKKETTYKTSSITLVVIKILKKYFKSIMFNHLEFVNC